MEELIWKYIDGVSSEEESATVKLKISQDAEWQQMFNKLTFINQELQQSSSLQMDVDFKEKLMVQGLHVMAEQKKEVSILPSKLILFLVTMFFVSLVVAFFAKDGASMISLPKLDPEIMNLVTWVSLSFLCLIGFDKLYKNMHLIKRNYHLVF